MAEHALAAIPGEGIGPEVISAGFAVLMALEQKLGGFRPHVELFFWDWTNTKKYGVMMPPDGLGQLRRFSAIYIGAIGSPNRLRFPAFSLPTSVAMPILGG